MNKSTSMLITAVAILDALIVVWGLLAPSQLELRMPLWVIMALLIGAIADRFICKRT